MRKSNKVELEGKTQIKGGSISEPVNLEGLEVIAKLVAVSTVVLDLAKKFKEKGE